jgi:hypothetical protein
MYMTGSHPECIDHINHDRFDNRWVNLREVSHSENMRNCRPHKSNKSGVGGVSFDEKRNRWIARASSNGNTLFRRLKSYEDAVAAVENHRMTCGFHENHGKKQ